MRGLEPGVGAQPVVEAVVDDGPVTVGPVERMVSTGVDAVRSEVAAGAEIARAMARSAPHDALVVAKVGLAVARTVAPGVRAYGNYLYDRAFGWVDLGIADIKANAAAAAQRTRSGRWLDFSGWSRLRVFRTRWDP